MFVYEYDDFPIEIEEIGESLLEDEGLRWRMRNTQ